MIEVHMGRMTETNQTMVGETNKRLQSSRNESHEDTLNERKPNPEEHNAMSFNERPCQDLNSRKVDTEMQK